MNFTLEHTSGGARAGVVHTDHGDIATPVFMPVGTQGTVKAVEHRELEEIGSRCILGNTYHLYLRPGTHTIRNAGGLHRFISWPRAILTDSGGYQVYSLSDLRGITEDGVTFKSHRDGSPHRFTPEMVIDTQRVLGSDIMMVLDECTPFPCDEMYARQSMELSLRWARRCREQMERTTGLYGHRQQLFAIVQGSVYGSLRERCARELAAMDFPGYAIGGLSVGESAGEMYGMTESTTAVLPATKARYLMGVGTPENILECIGRGIDMFDCVLPTRNARNALLFTRSGKLNLRHASLAEDGEPVDRDCGCYTCTHFSRAYLRHLFKSEEILGLQLATIHNLFFYHWLTSEARQAILRDAFASWKESIVAGLAGRRAA